MINILRRARKLMLLVAAIGLAVVSVVAQQDQLKIDPMMLVSLRECRSIVSSIGAQFYPGWKWEQTPILFYRPGVQDVLINYPHLPSGFHEFTGINPLGKEKIYVRDTDTLMKVDGQNTSAELEGIKVLVVADTFSRQRGDIRGEMRRDPEHQQSWLNDWSFIQSPYDDIRFMLHEGFHVYQGTRSPDKFADERRIADYPVLDVTNNALYALEGSIIRDALLTKDANERSKRIRQYVAVRHERVSKLPAELVEYESRNEFMEGLAHYVAYRWDQLGESVDPIPEMWYRNGFKGYKGVLGQQYLDAIKDMKPVIAVDDDRMGKKFGAGPLRWKLYEVGAAEALMLDYVYPQWKNEIFADGVYLGDLLERGVSMSNEQIADLLRTAKVDYGYEQAYKQKEAFAKEGNDKIQEKLNSIINTDGTLVHIYYGDLTSDAPRIRFTPFGVTRIGPSVAIYDTVPVGVKINDNNVLLMKNVRPVIVDKGERSITFAVPGSLDVASSPELRLDTNDLTLTVIGPVEAHRVGKELRIYLRKPQVQ